MVPYSDNQESDPTVSAYFTAGEKLHVQTSHFISFLTLFTKDLLRIALLWSRPLVVVRDRFKTIAVVGAAIRYALSLPFCKPSRVGVVAVPLEIGPHDGIGVIAVTWLKNITKRNLRKTFKWMSGWPILNWKSAMHLVLLGHELGISQHLHHPKANKRAMALWTSEW